MMKRNGRKSLAGALARAKNESGFTLVELIVVIAILGILACIGTVGYSGYIKKANMAADQQLIASIKNAVTLATYSNPSEIETGAVVVSTSGTSVGSNDFLKNAMDVAFGEDAWSDLALKYNEWTSKAAESMANSSFNDKEEELLGQVSNMTDVLSGLLGTNYSTLVGGSFSDYLSDLGVDTNNSRAVANASVLYAADGVKNLENKQVVIDAFSTDFSTGMSTAINELGAFGGLAVTYAMLEGICLASGNEDALNALHNADYSSVQSSGDAISAIEATIFAVEDAFGADFESVNADYFGEDGAAGTDVAAYFDIMTTISSYEDVLKESLGNEDCYTSDDVVNMFSNIASGEGSIVISVVKNGNTVVVTDSLPKD